MNVHPQNASGFEKVFPTLLASPHHLFCDREVKHKLKQKQFVPDLELVHENIYLDKVAAHRALELSPFVIDWANKLVAVDDDGLDRIMHHYRSCGMQTSLKVHHPSESDQIQTPSEPGSGILHPFTLPAPARAASIKELSTSMMCAVHPDVAEFADLF